MEILMQIALFFSMILVNIALFSGIFWMKRQIHQLKISLSTIKTQKKSSEVRLGQIAEQLAPFLDNFPYDPKKISFLGNPIDYVYFGDDKIAIIEVKSGNSRLSKKQKNIKKLVNEGKIEWKEVRIK